MLGRTSSAEPRKAHGHAAYGLAERRRTRRRRTVIALCILILILLGAGVWGLRQSTVRISSIEISGADASFSEYAVNVMLGSYFGIIPRNSIFFFPEERIRADILASHNDIAAVSILRSGFTGISIKIDYRVPVARWCGSTGSPQAVSSTESCYVFDANGLIFAAASSSIKTINSFALYAPPEVETLEPIGETIAYAEKLPSVFDFARELATLGSSAVSISIHDGEVDNILASGTRVTYVLGRERDAFTALISSRDNFNLADGSVDYIDLRFDGKVYVKKVVGGRE